MSSNQRKPSIQPRQTKASMLRHQQMSGSGLVTTTETKKVTEEKRTTTSRSSQVNNGVSASDGVKAFMAQQRARLQSTKKVEEKEPVQKKKTFMTGAERYGSGSDSFEKKNVSEPRKLQFVIKQAKNSGKLDISSRGLTKIPEEVLKMYHVDPKSIVIDFSSSGDAWYDAVEVTKFFAGDNMITEIDENFGLEFGSLTHIDFRDNRLISLPENFHNLQNLTSILLPYNQFEKIPDAIFELKKLKELDLSHNKISGEIKLKQTSIEKLDLGDNQIQSIYIEGNFKSNITKLNLSQNQIEKLPSLFGWTKLQELNVNQNKLKCLFEASNDKVELTSLVRLDAGNNLIKEISRTENVSAPKLIELVLMTNKLEESGLVGLLFAPNLKTLNISSNQLKNVPSSVTNLVHLERLDLRGNQLHTLSYELGKLENLKAINCEGNPMRSVIAMSQSHLIESLKSNYQQQLEEGSGNQTESAQKSIASNINEPVSKTDENTDTSDQTVTDLSTQFSQKINVTKKLDLSNKQLSSLTDDAFDFKDDIPGTIILERNVLTLFPTNLYPISNFIVQLNLEHNRLTAFNFTIENVVFDHLKVLKLSNNRIKSIECKSGAPTSFPKLEELSMNFNSLSALPEDLPNALPCLRIFSLSSNKLDNITERSFSKRIEILDLSNNDIGSLPSGLCTLENLKELIVFGNRFRVPRPAVVEQGSHAVLEFLRRRHNAN